MDNNIVDFNAYKKKKTDDQKKMSVPTFDDEYFDDEYFDDGFYDDAIFEDMGLNSLFGITTENAIQPDGTPAPIFLMIGDILSERGDDIDAETYEQQLCEKIADLETSEPSKRRKKAHMDWEEEHTYYVEKMITARVVDELLTRADIDDQEIEEKLKNGELKESDILVKIDKSETGTLNAILDYFRKQTDDITQNDVDGPTEESLASIRKMTYSIMKALDEEYEQLLREEPPQESVLMHNHWLNAIKNNRTYRNFVRILKAGILNVYDFIMDVKSGKYSELLEQLQDGQTEFHGDGDFWDYDDDDDDYEDDDDFWDDSDEDDRPDPDQ